MLRRLWWNSIAYVEWDGAGRRDAAAVADDPVLQQNEVSEHAKTNVLWQLFVDQQVWFRSGAEFVSVDFSVCLLQKSFTSVHQWR